MSSNFVETKEKVTFTFGGWDGKSYNGETRTQNVFVCPTLPGKKFIKFYSRRFKEYTYHVVNENELHKISGVPTVDYWCSEN